MNAMDAYRKMVSDERQKISDGAKEFMDKIGDDKAVMENTYRTFRFRLLNGNYRSKREKDLLLRLVSELKKVLES
ncbi:MAG: hypothetical protein N0E59_00800 [Candidatus Thiodiazotropha taylori]|nr:hypothetical protein [Candidatus Thiodiazotropha taylori]MCG8109280.1 hypothetical protein [Candidatus Thiodiazotropha taylori]MCW4281618.1 hypothetical protein [Candidatus Thiodiazotropha taylori]MCW4303589.1 hypothetical protein [Candidatus Thiodiazotropha taylori]